MIFVKRPLLTIALAFVLGEVLAFRCFIVFIFLCIILLISMFNTKIGKSSIILILLPIFFIAGYRSMAVEIKSTELEKLLEKQTIKSNVVGNVSEIQTKSSGYFIILDKVSVESQKLENQYFPYKIALYIKEKPNIYVGNIIKVNGALSLFDKPSNFGQFDSRAYYKSLKIRVSMYIEKYEIIDDSMDKYRQNLINLKDKIADSIENISDERDGGVFKSVFLGDKSSLDSEIKNLYQKSGIAHLLAISGLHISLIGVTLYQLCRKFGNSFLTSAIISGSVMVCYGIMTGGAVSARRAIIMFILMLISRYIGRTYDILSAVSLAAIIILYQYPLQLFQAGFQLSFGAIIGIGAVMPVIIKWYNMEFNKNEISGIEEDFKLNKDSKKFKADKLSMIGLNNIKVIDTLFTSLAMQFITFPSILYFYYQYPSYSILLNIIVVPLMMFVVISSLLGGVIGIFSYKAGIFFVGSGHYVLQFYEWICNLVQGIPYASVIIGKPNLYQIVLYYSILLAVLLLMSYRCNNPKINILHIKFDKKYIKFIAVSMATLLLVIVLLPVKNRRLEITFLDVGQGDGIFIKFPNQTTCLIDGGSTDVDKVGQYRIEPFLKAKGIKNIDYVFVTHTDFDHFSGVLELMELSDESGEVVIKNLVLGDTCLRDEKYEKLLELASENKINTDIIEKNDTLTIGRAVLRCLHPTYEYQPEDTNDTSIVLSLEYKDFSCLFTGDLSKKGENEILDSLRRYDILKVSHHGSKYSTLEDFLDIVKPAVSIISYGKDNSYGHPHEELLERLEKIKTKIYSTSQCGAITISTDGEKIFYSSVISDD